MKRTALAQRVRREHPDGNIVKLGGVFGEWDGCDGIVEQVVKSDKPTYVRIYGCSYVLNGYPHQAQVLGLELAKSLFMHIPFKIAKGSWIVTGYISLLFLFARKRLICIAEEFMDEFIIHRVVKHFDFPAHEYSYPVQAIREAIRLGTQTKTIWTGLIQKFGRFLCLFLQCDFAYRFRVQDAFAFVNHQNALRDGGRELLRLFDILISRETASGIGYKWRFIKQVLRLAFFFSPSLSKAVGLVLANLDNKQVKMDENDWYFSLRYISYNFGGLSKETRFNLRDSIDQEKGHIFLL